MWFGKRQRLLESELRRLSRDNTALLQQNSDHTYTLSRLGRSLDRHLEQLSAVVLEYRESKTELHSMVENLNGLLSRTLERGQVVNVGGDSFYVKGVGEDEVHLRRVTDEQEVEADTDTDLLDLQADDQVQ